MTVAVIPQPLARLLVPIAIVVLPLIAFFADRALGDYVADFTGLTLYALYVLGLIAYAFVSFSRSPILLSVSAGVLGTGAVISALVGVLGIIAALLILVLSLPWLGPPRSALERVTQFAVGLILVAIALSPWLTSWALGKTVRSALLGARRRSGLIYALIGICVAIAGMVLVAKADARWITQHRQAFETNDITRWEQSLREIKANPLCGHRRCLMRVCSQLTQRFGQASGECGPFACPFGFALDAPNVPSDLAAPFQTVYGYSVRQVCAIGD